MGSARSMRSWSLVQVRETYAAAVEAFGASRVHAPALLRVGQIVIEAKQ
jgi:hypothetical protein